MSSAAIPNSDAVVEANPVNGNKGVAVRVISGVRVSLRANESAWVTLFDEDVNCNFVTDRLGHVWLKSHRHVYSDCLGHRGVAVDGRQLAIDGGQGSTATVWWARDRAADANGLAVDYGCDADPQA